MYFCWVACLLGWWHIKKSILAKDKHTLSSLLWM